MPKGTTKAAALKNSSQTTPSTTIFRGPLPVRRHRATTQRHGATPRVIDDMRRPTSAGGNTDVFAIFIADHCTDGMGTVIIIVARFVEVEAARIGAPIL